MILIVLGLFLWWDAHVFKRLMPGPRAALTERFGEASKGIIASVLVGSIVFMVIGYRGADFIPVYSPPGWAIHVNNVLMLAAVVLFGMGSSKGRMRSWLRHPMMTGFALWAIAHLLVNGDLASILLFGGLLLWVPVTMLLINRAEPVWQPPEPGPLAGDIKLIVISLVVFSVIAGLHMWLGPSPFPGGGS